ncbi:MAG: nitrogen regulation protein NR(II) [Pseudomonadota bacterium]
MTDVSPSGWQECRILDNLTTTILLFDAGSRLRYVNTAGEILFAVSARHILGRLATELPIGPVQAHLEQARRGGLQVTERDVELTLADGRTLRVDCTLVPLGYAGYPGEVFMEIRLIEHFSGWWGREDQQISQQSALTALIRGLAHEIRNPLGGLRGAAQLLQQELPDPALREYTEIIIAEADRLQSLVNRVLGTSGRPRRQPLNIHQLLERVRQLVGAESAGALPLRSDYDPSLPEISGDADQLIQALLNVVRNAARAAGHGGEVWLRTRVSRQVTIGTVRHRLAVRIEIQDNGPGVNGTLQDKIFLPMVSGCEGGAGLGLSIAQSLIRQHGGLIVFRSRPGETVFSILLPVESRHGKA